MSTSIITRSLKRKFSCPEVKNSVIIKRKFVEHTCPICMDEIIFYAALDICLHEFCLNCISNWLLNIISCPQCKQIPHSILYKVKDNSFTMSIVLDKQFEEEWNKQFLAVNFFKTRRRNMKTLRKSLMSLLKNFKFSISYQRLLFYFCDMKTTLYKKYQAHWNPQDLVIDPSHKIWQWLSMELSVFFNSKFVKQCLTKLKSDIFCYKDLVKELSNLIPEPILSKFLSEMNIFISFFDSFDNYYYLQDAKLIFCQIPGEKCLVFDNGCVNLSFLCKILTNKIYQLEYQTFEPGNDDITPLFEISHIDYLVNILTRTDIEQFREETLMDLWNFITLKLRRSVNGKPLQKELEYANHYQLNEKYRYIYHCAYLKEVSKCHHSVQSEHNQHQLGNESEMQSVNSIDLTAD